MANVKISGLPTASTPLTGAELVPVVQSGVTSQTTVSDFGAAVSYTPSGTGAVATTVQAKLRETVSVKDFGAVGNGVADDTAAFNYAIATGKKVIVPYTVEGYVVSNINVVSNMYIVGEKSGLTQTGVQDSPKLIVKTSGTAAFYNTATDVTYDVWIENFLCTAASGVTNACFYKTSQVYSSAYFTFKDIETYKNLRYAYFGMFIYCRWEHCRDGYNGSATDSQHTFVSAIANAYGQACPSNMNMFRDCIIFNSFGGDGAIVASYGQRWTFENCGFEGNSVPVITTYNLYDVTFRDCWIENTAATSVFNMGVHPVQINAGSSLFIHNCTFVLIGTPSPTYLMNLPTFCWGSIRDCVFTLIPSGMTLTNDSTKLYFNENNILSSGAGASGFMTGMHPVTYENGKQLINNATDNGNAAANIQINGGICATKGFFSTLNTSIYSASVTISIANPCVITWSGHGLIANQPVVFTTTGTLPTGITAGTVYYVVSPTTNTFNISATAGGAAIVTSGSQSGTHTCSPYFDLAESNTGYGGLCFITGISTHGTSPVAWWLVAFLVNNPATATIISSNDTTGLTPAFQVSGQKLQMKVSSYSMYVNVTFLN